MTASHTEVVVTPERDREYPTRPVVGVAGVVLDADRVLLIRRGRQPMLGEWSLPGGALELGETMAQGVAREVWEETGVRVRPVELVATLDRMERDGAGAVRFHYLLIDWVCVLLDGQTADLLARDDALEAAWASCDDLAAYGLPEVVRDVIEQARRLLVERVRD